MREAVTCGVSHLATPICFKLSFMILLFNHELSDGKFYKRSKIDESDGKAMTRTERLIFHFRPVASTHTFSKWAEI